MTNSDIAANSAKLSYEISKEYVNRFHPELSNYFDNIWQASLQNDSNLTNSSNDTLNIGIGFLTDTTLMQLTNIVLPFVSGLISSVVAEIFLQKVHHGSTEIAKIVEDKAKRSVVTLRLDKQVYQQVLPIILSILSKYQNADVQTNSEEHLEQLLDDRLKTVYLQIKKDKEIAVLLLHIQNAHPNFTSHGLDHSETVVSNIEKLIPQEDWQKLSKDYLQQGYTLYEIKASDKIQTLNRLEKITANF